MEWWKELYGGDTYFSIFAPFITEDKTKKQVDFIVEKLNIHKADKILDLCCGTGRHSLELSRRGYEVVGQDWSENYLAQARNSAKREKLSVDFFQSDMRHIDGHESFDIIINMFTSFGYFDNDYENELVLKEVEKALRPNGLFLLDLINPTQLIRFPIPVTWHEDKSTDEIIIRERYIDFFTWRLEETCSVFTSSGCKKFSISYRLYTLAELKNMLIRNGLIFERAYGDYNGSDCCENYPPRMIVVSRKQR